jgi:hypothetical protein
MSVDPLDERLAALDPARRIRPASSSALGELREEMLIMTSEAMTAGPVHPVRTRRKKSITGAGISVIAVLTLAGAAAAGGYAARTGLFGSGGEEGSGEMIRTDAPDAATVVGQLGAGIPLPPGGSFAKATASMQANGGLTSEDGVRMTLSWSAACQWATYWLDGDGAERVRAQATLDQIPTWTALVSHNPDGGVKVMWQHIADAARAGDANRLRDSGYTVNCLP